MRSRRRAAPSARGFELTNLQGLPEQPDLFKAELLALANEALRGTAAADALGPLSVAPERYPADALGASGLRSEPLTAFGGGEFRFNGGTISDGLPARLLVEGLREAAAQFLVAREHIARDVEATRREAQSALDAIRHPAIPARIAAIGVGARSAASGDATFVDLEMLGADLRLGVDRVRPMYGDLRRELDEHLAAHSRRADRLDEHLANGHRGAVQRSALLLMQLVGMELSFALQFLRSRREMRFMFGRKQSGYLSWFDGELISGFTDRGSGLWMTSRTLGFRSSLPMTAIIASVGRPVGDILEHPLVPAEATVVDASEEAGEVRLTLDVPMVPLSYQ